MHCPTTARAGPWSSASRISAGMTPPSRSGSKESPPKPGSSRRSSTSGAASKTKSRPAMSVTKVLRMPGGLNTAAWCVARSSLV
ncbi:MAG: hypothetical protein IPN17_35080 [Deltaproteobacteria bacterium]|nr:hypothetical protein [Deltaproteobacteria bacterium]